MRIVMLLLLSSCCGPHPSEASTWRVVGPEYMRYVEADPSLSPDEKGDRALLIATWRLRAGVR